MVEVFWESSYFFERSRISPYLFVEERRRVVAFNTRRGTSLNGSRINHW